VTVKALVQQFIQLGAVANPAAAKAEIETLTGSLGLLPKELTTLYSALNGMAEKGRLPFRLLSIAEVLETNTEWLAEPDFPQEARVFWEDENGGYAAVYLSGTLQGKVCAFDHDEPDYSPRFRDCRSFLRAQIAAALGGTEWCDLPGDFPPPKSAPADNAAFAKFLEDFKLATNPRTRRKLAFDVMALCPQEAAPALLLNFLDDEDLWVQERAAELLGKRSCEGAVPKLFEVVCRPTARVHNARIAAILALGRMQSDSVTRKLEALAGELAGSGFGPYFIKAFELAGWNTKLEPGGSGLAPRWWYCPRDSDTWKAL
jgi:hypothetical protein